MSLTVSLLVNAVVVLAFLWFIRRDRDATAGVLADLSKQAHEREMTLCQRIQAPKAETTRWHYEQDEPLAPKAIRTDDEPGGDETWWSTQLSKEEMARLAAEEEVSRG